jgi:phosphopantothenoylcysteine decarboxylase/phosphopantothenate--cysteine ligase
MGHIELARWADAILIAPATADCMARLAKGYADDLLSTVCLAAKAPVVLAPAMNQAMWKHMTTQENLQVLQQKKITIIGPDAGSQACGDIGAGRMSEPMAIVERMSTLFSTGTLAGVNVLITAGPTHEAIDPVRYITNGSSGKMGYALAEAAHEAGANVTLISGPVSLPTPIAIPVTSVTTAQEMHEAVMKNIAGCDIFLAVAAVGDYRSQTIAEQKLHKGESVIQITCERNPDIVLDVGQLPAKPFIVGFAAETENVIAQAQAKRQRKNMDLIVANRVGHGIGMGSDENEVTVLGPDAEWVLPLAPKHALARQLITLISDNFKKKRQHDGKCNTA